MTHTQLIKHIKTLADTVRCKDQQAFERTLGKLAPAQAALVVECLGRDISADEHEGCAYDTFFSMLRDAAE